jgi:hypothetical protein
MIIEILFALSLISNVVMVLYVRWVLNNYKEVVKGLDSIGDLITEYVMHLKSVYELDMFYGDDTLSNLLKHGKEIVEKLDNIEMLGENESESESDENDKDDDQ